jgi:hypothetical protein
VFIIPVPKNVVEVGIFQQEMWILCRAERPLISSRSPAKSPQAILPINAAPATRGPYKFEAAGAHLLAFSVTSVVFPASQITPIRGRVSKIYKEIWNSPVLGGGDCGTPLGPLENSKVQG